MVSTTSAIDLSQLPVPEVVEQFDYETILQDALVDFHSKMDELGIEYPRLVESDPAYKLAEVFAYREMLIRDRANKSALAVLLAYAEKSDLDHKAAEKNLIRRVITPADNSTTPPTPAIMESDASLRKRIQLAPEGYTTAGSEGSYIFHAQNADVRIKDVEPTSPSKGVAAMYVLSSEGNGTASEELITIVDQALNKKIIRPLTDEVQVYSASIIQYRVNAVLEIANGPDKNIVLKEAFQKVKEYTESVHKLNTKVSLTGIIAALNRDGVIDIDLIEPVSKLEPVSGQAAYCTEINLKIKGENNA
ncbi:TPA: baseplate J family protein [Acinetobacter baumannii]|nr:baseplate J family protein [Acinetobacter baumannii]